ncbi:MAG: hypothetical protein EHM48_06725 [Planctomycetaceae bacterium]|nr:MAG: hypothetical protein EHM48_06725 [Planctomycetaceae bacterium]
MPSKYQMFDRNRLSLLPLAQRIHDVDLTQVLSLGQTPVAFDNPDLPAVAQAVIAAKKRGATVALMMGAHVIKQGLSRYVIDMIRRGWVSVIGMNGACSIHDFEMARIGATYESVAKYISAGQFGLWNETGQLNDIVQAGNAEGLGYGEAVGRFVSRSDFPNKDVSIFAAAYECNVPATVHIGIGYDIIHQHPNFNAAAVGEASYRDFLIYAKTIENLDGGVLLCVGSAVMGPEVYLKALAMARNVAASQGRFITKITSAVFDLLHLSGDLHAEAPKDKPEYYYRPYKTILVRTVKDGGKSYYIRGDHRGTIPALHRLLCKMKI